MKKIAKISIAFIAALALAGCSQNSNEKKSSTKKSSGVGMVIRKKKQAKMGHLSSDDLSPQKTVAVVIAYAGTRYSDTSWHSVLNQAEKKNVQVNLKNQSDYSYMKNGSGVTYQVSDNAAYTLKQVNGENVYYLYSNKTELGSVTMKQMVDYLNKKDLDTLVNNIADGAKVVDQRSDSSDNSDTNSNSSTKKSDVPADGGLFNIPSEYQGTWYTYFADDNKLTTLTISQHKISDGKYTTELHKVDNSAGDYIQKYQTSKSYMKITKNWGCVKFWNREGIKFMNVMGWMQSAGDGEFYGIHTEKGQTVLVIAGGAGLWTDCVAWKSPQLAQQYKHKKFSDLHYQDDDE